MFKDGSFFDKYNTQTKKDIGIPGLDMNKPIGLQSGYSGKIGIELEIEGLRLPNAGHIEAIKGEKTGAVWNAINDGSLRGENFEYVLSKPIFEEELPSMINNLYDVFKANRTELRCSNRCSTHIHINMKGKKVNQITSIIAAWAIFEEALINWHGEQRIKNHFCLSTSDSTTLVDAWRGLLENGSFQWPNGVKYSALNILTLNSFGSLEFRCGQAPTSPEKVITWATFLSKFVDYVDEHFPNPASFAYDLSERGPDQIFEDICNTPLLKDFRDDIFNLYNNDSSAFNDSCMKGFYNVQPIVLGFPWEEWMEQINREFVPNPFGDSSPKKPQYFNEAVPIAPDGPDEIRLRGQWLEENPVPIAPPQHPDHPTAADATRGGTATLRKVRRRAAAANLQGGTIRPEYWQQVYKLNQEGIRNVF